MKRITVLLLLIMAFSLWGAINLEYEGERVFIHGSFELENILEQTRGNQSYNTVKIKECNEGGNAGDPIIGHYSKLLALPNGGNWQVSKFSYTTEEIKLDNELLYHGAGELSKVQTEEIWYPEAIVKISEPVIMRQERFCQISISAFQYNEQSRVIRVLKDIHLELEIDRSERSNEKRISGLSSGRSFDNLIQSVAGSESNRSSARGNYLFICPDNANVISSLNYLVDWKRKLGYQASIATLTETGDTTDEIKDYLQNAYDNWDNKPEYVVLVGDVNGGIMLPSWYIQGYLEPYCVTDHPYTLLEGEDYFPDIMLGRFSVQSLSQLQTIISKIINYERNPITSSDWTRRALMLAFVADYGGNYAMYSQRETVMAVREKLLDFTYTEVDTFIAPWQSGSSNLTNYINTGYSFINYRGAGSPVYWSGGYDHMYNISDIGTLSNGFMLPMVTSIVCGGGNFAYSNYDTCFGEEWLAAGSASNPRGAIGFIGPSEHDTKTPFNNCNDMGIYQGITQEGIFGCAEMMLRGKMELYNNYPGCHSMDGINDAWDSDMFYFYVYNLLGDPGLKVWTDSPLEYDIELPESVGEGTGSIEIDLDSSEFMGHTVALTGADGLYSTAELDETGWAALMLPLEAGDYEITISGYGYIPYSQALVISDEQSVISVLSEELSGNLIPGSEVDLLIELQNNTGIEQSDLTVSLESSETGISISNPEIAISELGLGDVIEINYELTVSENWRESESCWFELEINAGDLGHKNIELLIESAEIEYSGRTVQNLQNSLLAGEENDVLIELYNAGEIASGSFTAIIGSSDNKCEIISGNCTYGDIAVGETESGSCNFVIEPAIDLISGEPMKFDLIVIQNSLPVWQTEFVMEAGVIAEHSPTFSEYGYYAIESSDTGNFTPPEYNWLEIDPYLGGGGIQVPQGHVTSDGFSTCIPLPFEFCYYGRFYNEITVSSSGWLAMGDEEYVFFRNRIIPSGVGVDAMIAVYWDFLQDGEIYTYYDEWEHCYYIEWSGFHDDFLHENQTFQVILYDPAYHETATGDGEIKFQYQEIHNNDQSDNYATIGIENHSQTEGLLLSYADQYPQTVTSIAGGKAILFTINEGNPSPSISASVDEIHLSVAQDTLISSQFELFNESSEGGLSYELSIRHFASNRDGGSSAGNVRDISGDSVNLLGSATYYTGYELDVYGFIIHNTPDNEAIDGIRMEFPDYVNILSATDIAELYYNEESGAGATVTWGYGNGEDYNTNLPQLFHIYMVIDDGITSPIPINWEITGDGTGSEPHSAYGIVTLMPSEEKYIWLESPNGGEEFAYGVDSSITWSSYGEIGAVDIFYSEDGFTSYEVVAEGIENTGSYDWTVPWELTESGKIRIRESDGNVYDDTDGWFSIKALVITYPDPETVLEYGSTVEICWDYLGAGTTVDIDYSASGGYYWDSIVNEAPNTGSYEFLVNIPPTDHGKLRIITWGDEMIVSEMEGEFSVVDVPVSWLIFPELEGEIEASASETVSFDVDTQGMLPGEYEAYIRIRTNYNQELSIPVLLEVQNVDNENAVIPANTRLKRNYPNPFFTAENRSAGTVIEFSIGSKSRVQLSVYNLRGQLVSVLIDEKLACGNYSQRWDGKDQRGLPTAAGVYFYQLKVDDKMVATNKCLLLK